AGLFDIEDFTLERKDGLVFAIAAHFCGATGRFTFDDEEFAAGRIAFLAVGELSWQAAGIHRGFTAGEFAGLAGGFAGAGGVNALADDAARDGGVLVEPVAELFVDELFDVALDVAVELALGLAFELGLRKANADDGDETFANVVTGDGDFVFLLFQHAGVGCEIVDGAREGGAEAGEMGAAVDGVDGVGEREDVFAVGVVVLQGDFDFDGAFFTLHVDRRIVEGGLAAIEVLDELGDAAGEAEFGGLFAALVIEGDFQAFVEESVFAEARRQSVVTEYGLFENTWIRMKGNFRAGLAGIAGPLHFFVGLALRVALLPDAAVTQNFEFEPVGKGVDNGDANTMETTGNFIGVAIEFSTSVEDGENHFGSRTLFGGVQFHRNAAAIVYDRYGVVGVNGNVDFVGVAGHGLVDGIVHHFPDEVVEAHLAGRADVHRGAETNGFQAAEDFNGFRVVLMSTFDGGCFFIAHLLS